MSFASNTRDMFRGAIKSRRIGQGNSGMHFSVISICRFRNAASVRSRLTRIRSATTGGRRASAFPFYFNFTFVIFMPSNVGCIVWLGFLVSHVSAQKLRHSFGNLYHACLTSIVAIDDKREIEWFLETPDHVVLIRRKN